jgi:hypothetical protein
VIPKPTYQYRAAGIIFLVAFLIALAAIFGLTLGTLNLGYAILALIALGLAVCVWA